jgi:tetratricopeptide (TPR) repeat protein
VRTREVSHWVRLPRSPEAVWDFITSTDHWRQWWWGDDDLMEVDPGWEKGARLVFDSDWVPTLDEFSPPTRLAFGGHVFELSETGDGGTRFAWAYSGGTMAADTFDPISSAEEEVDAELRLELENALRRLAEALEASADHRRTPSAGEPGGAETVSIAAGPAGPTPPAPQREVRVFVSSTFKDMGAERDELSKRAFIELRRICEDRGVAWTDVDLRWGITDEQKAEGEILPICLTEIENCRPYFLGILGERYGWVPEEIPKDQVEREPWLAEDKGRSVTEMEVLHGVLNNPEMAQHAFFYFRDPHYVETLPEKLQSDYRELPTEEEISRFGPAKAEKRAGERRRRLVGLKERIQARGFPVSGFRDPQELGPLVVRDLGGVLDRLFPAESAPGLPERAAAAHEGVAREAQRVYVPRLEHFHHLDEHALGEGPPLVVRGKAGSGKSALLANWALEHRKIAPGEPMIFHSVGASPESASWDGMLRRILGELAGKLGLEIDLPDHPEALRQTFAKVLNTAAGRSKVVIIIDGLNQLEDRDQALDLVWLPPNIPAKIRLLLSTLPGRPLEELKRRGWPWLEVGPLDREEQRRLIQEYLGLYRKALSGDHLERILASSQTGNPLFLRTLLGELRLHGDHHTLGRAIDHYLDSSGLPELFEKVMNRFEEDYERERPGLVKDALTLMWAARRGLTEDEILDLLGSNGLRLPRAFWSPFHLAAGHLLANRSGFLSLSHEHLRLAVVNKYMPGREAQLAAHRSLAAYFGPREMGTRRLDELPWQLSRSNAWDELADLMADMDFFKAAWEADEFDARRYWTQIEDHSTRRMVDAYGEAIRRPAAHGKWIWTLAALLTTAGYLDEALRLREALSEKSRSKEDLANLMASLGNQAHLLQALGRWDEALQHYEEQETVARRIGRRNGLAVALSGQAGIHRVRGHLDKALELHEQEERVHRKLGDQEGLQYCLGNQGMVLVEQSNLDRAMQLRKEQERISRQIGQADGVRIALDTQSVILRMRGELDEALDLSREAERICRELGDRGGLATNLVNQGIIFLEQGASDAAFSLFQEAERICRDLGGVQDLSVALANQAAILQERGEIEKALGLYREVEEISRPLGYAMGLQNSLGEQGRIRLQYGDTGEALSLLEKQEEICREMGYPLELTQCLNLKGMALSMLGRRGEAEATWKETRDLVERHGLRRG